MHTIEITLAVTDAQGATTQLNAIFEDTLARWPELHAEFAKFSEAVHKTVFHENGPVLAKLQQDFPEDYQSGFAAPQVVTSKFENVDPEALNLMSGGTMRDYGVQNMTAAEVQDLLAKKDAEIAKLREAVTGLQDEVAKRRHISAEKERTIEDLEAQLATARRSVGALTKRSNQQVEQIAALQRRNDSQKTTIIAQDQRIQELTTAAPGVADLRERYNELMQQMHNGAMEDTKLQDERDIARRERDRAIRDLHDLQAVHDDLRDQFNDQTERLNESQRQNRIVAAECKALDRKLLEAVAARSAADKQVNQLKDSATKRVEKHVEQLDAAEKRFQALKKDAYEQAEAMGRALVEAVEAAETHIDADSGALSAEMIHKSDAVYAVKGILKRCIGDRSE